MNPLGICLESGNSYTGAGNAFSRFLILETYIQKKGAVCVFVESQREIQEYQKLAVYFKIPFYSISSQHHFISLKNNISGIYVAIIDDITQPVHKEIPTITFQVGTISESYADIESLNNLGYTFGEHGGKGTYKKQGDTLKIQEFEGYYQYIVSYWGEEIESITLQKIAGERIVETKNIERITLGSHHPLFSENGSSTLRDIISESGVFTVFDTVEFSSEYKNSISRIKNTASFDILGDSSRNIISLGIEILDIQTLEGLKGAFEDSSKNTSIYTKHKKLIEDFLNYNSIENIQVRETHTHILKSFVQHATSSNKKGVCVICDDIINTVFTKKRVKRKLSEDVDLLLKIKKGDYIIHIDHGIGVFHEIVKKDFGNISKEYIELHYKENDKLFVPITEVSRISKYVGMEHPKLTPLSGKIWEKKIAKIREDIQVIAEELLHNFAQRKLRPGIAFSRNTGAIEKFQSNFPYTYTSCQETAIEEILSDMEKDTTMDRLLVGDVGFGKTEIAFNTIYNAIENKKQVAFIAPLVVLAYEHYEKALERFSDIGVTIEVLTRMESAKNTTQVLKGLKDGSVDIVIGTHKLLGKNIHFKNLGLIVIDEEHKFGVQDKEKIKSMKSEIDVLSMSATPIPRSLNLALSGIRDISILKTPPEGRKNIETLISPYEEKIIIDAGNKEFERGGQVFFVHNRVVNIEVYKKNLQRLFPKKKIIITHGQLPGDELENRILDFKHKKYDILLSTTVIENGIDFSNVNTIFINECQSFGISQLHQLRGRVGRSAKKGYCYLLYRKENLSNETAKRLHTVVNYSYLGAGFELAMKDLEIRGGGDILGIRQSGQVQEIGISLFLKMLEEKIEELRENKDIHTQKNIYTSIDLQISASIPEDFFQSETDKIQFYREIESLKDIEELDDMIQGFQEVNTDIPETTVNLFQILRTKILANNYHIGNIKKVGIHYQIDFIPTESIEHLKTFLALDRAIHFHVVDATRLRCATKVFENDKKFLQYVLNMLEKRAGNPRIKLKIQK